MNCAKCGHEARGHVPIGEARYPLCNGCARNVEKSAERVVRQLAFMIRGQRGVNRLWEKA